MMGIGDTNQRATTSNVSARSSYAGEGDAAEAAVANLLHDLISLLQRGPALGLALGVGIHVRRDWELVQSALLVVVRWRSTYREWRSRVVDVKV